MTWLKLTEVRVHDDSFGFCLIHNNQEVPIDNFGKFQPHQTADDKVVKTSGVSFRIFFKSFWGPVNNAFVVSFKLRFLKLNLLRLVDK